MIPAAMRSGAPAGGRSGLSARMEGADHAGQYATEGDRPGEVGSDGAAWEPVGPLAWPTWSVAVEPQRGDAAQDWIAAPSNRRGVCRLIDLTETSPSAVRATGCDSVRCLKRGVHPNAGSPIHSRGIRRLCGARTRAEVVTLLGRCMPMISWILGAVAIYLVIGLCVGGALRSETRGTARPGREREFDRGPTRVDPGRGRNPFTGRRSGLADSAFTEMDTRFWNLCQIRTRSSLIQRPRIGSHTRQSASRRWCGPRDL